MSGATMASPIWATLRNLGIAEENSYVQEQILGALCH